MSESQNASLQSVEADMGIEYDDLVLQPNESLPPPAQWEEAVKAKNLERAKSLEPFAKAFQGLRVELDGAKAVKDIILCKKLKAKLILLPPTLAEFKAKKAATGPQNEAEEEVEEAKALATLGSDADADSTEPPAWQQLAAFRAEHFVLYERLEPFVEEFEALKADLAAAEKAFNTERYLELSAKLQAFPKTLREFEAMKMAAAAAAAQEAERAAAAAAAQEAERETIRTSPKGGELGKELIKEIDKKACDLGKVKELVGKGASVKEKAKDGNTALHGATDNGLAEVLTVLLDAGADKEAKNKYGNTALHRAAYNGRAKALTVLLDAGADKEAKNNDGRTALHRAALKARGEALTVLLDAGADKEAKDNDGNTALHGAARNGQAKALTVLLDAGADKEAKNKDGSTALHAAARNGQAKALTVLLDAGADKEAKNKSGRTSRDLAIEDKKNQWREVVQLLDAHPGGGAPGKLKM